MGLFKRFVRNTEKPQGFLGAMMIRGMNAGHAKCADWGMGQFPRISPEQIVDLGCGGGRNAAELLKRYPGARLTAVDYSPLSVEKTRDYNRDAITAGRCAVVEGDVKDLAFEEGTFDLATAFETIYFWPGLEACFGEVRRVLKKGGYFVIVSESDGTDPESLKFSKIIDKMETYTVDQIRSALTKAGFTDIVDSHHEKKPWITVEAKNPGR